MTDQPRHRIEVLHGVNLDQLGRRDPDHYGTLTLPELEREISRQAAELGLATRFFHSNHEGGFVEHLHGLHGDAGADGLILNPGAWTHYAYAIRDAVELCGLPAVEVHLSEVDAREEFRHHSVLDGVVVGRVAGRGPDGYRDALATLLKELDRDG